MNKGNAKDYLPLVQALADGKKIQWLNTYGIWEDSEELSTSWIPGSYRIKPESREIWVNRSNAGILAYEWFLDKETAEHDIRPGWTPVCFREVIE